MATKSGMDYKTKVPSNQNVDYYSGAVRTITLEHSKIHEGEMFHANYEANNVASNGIVYVEMQSPAGMLMHFKDTIVSISNGYGRLEILENPTLTTGSNILPCINFNRVSPITTCPLVLKTNPTGISGGTSIFNHKFGEGTGQGSSLIGGKATLDEFVLPGDSLYLLRVTNLHSSAVDLDIYMKWYVA